MASSKKWTLIFSPEADRQFSRLDRPVQDRIFKFFDKVLVSPDPKISGKLLTGKLKSFWSYRIGSYRIMCHFENKEMIVFAVKIGHRRDVYNM